MFSGFGGGTGFGAQQPQQQPATGFGGFGAQAQPQQTTGFGGFGAQQQQPQTGGFGTGGFGATQPTAGGFGAGTAGGFGTGTTGSAFGGGGGFGSGTQTTGLFGNTSSAAQPSGFGGFGASTSTAPAPGSFGAATGTSTFGKPATGFGGFGATPQPTPATGFGATGATTGFGAGTSAFGASTPAAGGMFGSMTNATNDQVNNGTGSPPYQFTEVDEPGTNGTMVKVKHNNICSMPAYSKWSFEELRLKDYEMNKKFAGQGGTAGSSFGTSSFGTSTPGFGTSAPAFGAAATSAPATGMFGAATGGFGAQQPTSGFGFGAAAPSTGLFGAQQQPASTAPSIFGSAPAATPGFGASATPAFGAQPSTGGFGGGFGAQQQQQKPAFGFGGTSTSTAGGFGATPSFGGTSTAGSTLFGAKPATTQSTGFSFGAPAASSAPSGFGATPATVGFGLGGTSSAGAGLFGAKPATSGFGTFGATPASSAPSLFSTATPASAPLFGGSTTQTPSIFGAASQAQPTSSLFGYSTAGGFGTTPAFGTQQSAGLFNQQKPGGFGFGVTSSAAPTGGMFGAPTQGSLFGTSQPQGGFGAPASGGGMFGGGVTTAPLGQFGVAPQQQANLRASIDQNPYGVNPIFASTKKQEPALYPVQEEKKKPPMTPYAKVTPREASKIKLRGFGPSPLARPPTIHGASRYESALSTPKDDATLGLDARFTPRKSVRRLIIEEPVEVSAAATPNGKGKTPAKKGVTFDLQLEKAAAREFQEDFVDVTAEDIGEGSSTSYIRTPSPASFNGRRSASPLSTPGGPGTPTPGHRARASASPPLSTPGTPSKATEYLIEPPVHELLLMSDEELRSVSNFKISVPGIGSIKWLEPVDLLEASPTKTRAGLDKIVGSIVILQHKLATVYPDDANKPPIGFGLNVRAEITLEKCWPVDKSTREYILDVTDPRFDRHIKKLETMADTAFLGYHNPTGTWKFEVEHFSRYGLDDDDDEDHQPQQGAAQRPVQRNQQRNVRPVEEGSPFFVNAQGGMDTGLTGLGDVSVNSEVEDSMRDFRNARRGRVEPPEKEPSPPKKQSQPSRPPTSVSRQRASPPQQAALQKESPPKQTPKIFGLGSMHKHLPSKPRWGRMKDITNDLGGRDEEEDQVGGASMEEVQTTQEDSLMVEDEDEEFVEASTVIIEGDNDILTESIIMASSSAGRTPYRPRTASSRKGKEASSPDDASSPATPMREPLSVERLETAHSVQKMKASLFTPKKPEESKRTAVPKRAVQFNIPERKDNEILRELSPIEESGVSSPRVGEKRVFIDDGREDFLARPRSGFGLQDENESMEVDENREREREIRRSPNKYFKTGMGVLPPLEKSVVYGRGKEVVDAGLMMGRSFRVGWGPGGVLIRVGSSFAGRKSFSNVSVQKVNVFGAMDEKTLATEQARHEKTLEVALDNSVIERTITANDAGSGWEYRIDDDNEETARIPAVPKATLVSQLNFLRFVDAIFGMDDMSVLRGGARTNVFSEQEVLVWKLAAALWDPVGIPEEVEDKELGRTIEEGLRREDISRWLKEAVKGRTDRDAAGAKGARKVFTLLAGRQMSKAVMAAVKNGDLRLGSILSQLGGAGSRVLATPKSVAPGLSRGTGGHGIPGRYGTDEAVAEELNRQMDVWNEMESRGEGMSGIDIEYMRVWKLAAGNMGFWDSEIFEPLGDWKRTLGLFFWYGGAGALNLDEALHWYETSFENSPDVKPPLPLYLEKSGKPIEKSDVVPKDVCYHLLKLYQMDDYLLEKALHPSNISENELDYRVSWLVWNMLSNVKKVRAAADSKLETVRTRQVFDDPYEEGVMIETDVTRTEAVSIATADRLTRDLVWQLEGLGLWKWAVFVAMFFGRVEERERVVREVLGRWYPLNDDSGSWARKKRLEKMEKGKAKERREDGLMDVDELEGEEERDGSDTWWFLVERLRVPVEWIHEARALRAKYEGNVLQEAISLIDARMYGVAHRVIIGKIALEDVINEDYKYVKELLQQIPEGAVDAQSWANGGKLFLDFIEIMENVLRVIVQARDYVLGYSLSSSLLLRSGYGFSALDQQVEADVARRAAQDELRDKWLPKLKRMLEELGRVNKFVGEEKWGVEVIGLGMRVVKERGVLGRVCRVEMTSRIAGLVGDAEKVLSEGDVEVARVIGGGLLSTLKVPPGMRRGMVQRLVGPLVKEIGVL